MKNHLQTSLAISAILLCLVLKSNAQVTFGKGDAVSYTVDEANATKWDGFVHFELSSHLLGTTGLGFSAGAQSQFKLPVLPILLAGRFRYEGFGIGKVIHNGEAYGPSRNLELAALFPVIPGRKKDARVKVTTLFEASNTSTYEEYFYATGQKKNDLLARGGLFQYWTKGDFSTTGFAAGLTYRMRKHVDVSLSNEEGYHREVFMNNQIYFDVLYAPIITGIREGEGYHFGGRLGFLRAASSGANYYAELEFRPGVVAALTFGLLFGWDRI